MHSNDEARAWFAEQGLPFPPLPAELAARLAGIAPNLFSSRSAESLPASPYDLSSFIEEAAGGNVPDYVLVGHDGHGLNSHAVHCYLVRGRLGILIQIPFGGAYNDDDKAREDMAQIFTEHAPLMRATAPSPKDAGDRLLVVISGFYGPRFRLPGADWQEGTHSMPSLLAALQAA